MGKNIQTHKCSLTLLVDGVDKELLTASGKNYKGEVAFFAINERYRGMGLGRRLFQTVVDYMKSQNIPEFYLFTDTSCNYRFYEHIGLKKRGEKELFMDVNGQGHNMTFLLYEYRINPDSVLAASSGS